MRQISDEKKLLIKQKLLDGATISEVSNALNISKSTVQKYKVLSSLDLPFNRGGRCSKLSQRDENLILRKILKGEVDTATELARSFSSFNVSPQTIRRVLKKAGLKAAAKVKKPLLSKKHRKARLDFAESHKFWTVEDWKKVIFSDETKINRIASDGRKWCWKQPRSGLSDRVVSGTVKFGGGSVMVWGCFCFAGVGYMAKIDNRMDAALYCRILEDELMDTFSFYSLDRNETIFQQDNDPKHKAKLTMSWLDSKGIKLLDWPAQSPDLNPIENLWSHLKKQLQKFPEPSTGILQLWERIQVAWEAISKDFCVKLIESMPARINAVLSAKGGYTKY